jgi:hypothetical protein
MDNLMMQVAIVTTGAALEANANEYSKIFLIITLSVDDGL